MKWIHLSDIHFGHHKEDVRERVDQELVCKKILEDAEDLTKKIGSPDFILVTGDIAYRADSSREYPLALEWFEDLGRRTGVAREHVFFVPGNHDVDRSVFMGEGGQKNGFGRIQDSLRNDLNPDAYFQDETTQSAIWLKFRPYSDFVAQFGTSGISSEQPYWKIRKETAFGFVTFVGLNSCLLSYDGGDSVTNLALGAIQRQFLDDCPKGDLIIAMQHHPVGWLTDREEIEYTLGRRAHILLCGHVHSERGQVTRELSGLECFEFRAGATHLEPGGSTQHRYTWFELAVDEFIVYPRVWDRNRFVRDGIAHEALDENGGLHKDLSFLPIPFKEWLTPDGSDEGLGADDDQASDDEEHLDTAEYELNALNQSVKWMKEAICYDQGEYFQFHFLASQIHKEMKDLISYDPYAFGDIKEYLFQLYDFLTKGTRAHYRKYFDFILNFFEGTSKYRISNDPPRVCVKQNFNNTIVPFSRYGGAEVYDDQVKVEDNTGFLGVKKEGLYYLCQDIPSAAAAREYKNPRLLSERAVAYSGVGMGLAKDAEWVSCWKSNWVDGKEVAPDVASCYKSTLIVPMTLLNNKMKTEFVENFHVDPIGNNLVDRTVFGYLCFDHVCEKYFIEEFDSQVGYIFADIMSRYLLSTFNFTNASTTYNELTSVLQALGLFYEDDGGQDDGVDKTA